MATGKACRQEVYRVGYFRKGSIASKITVNVSVAGAVRIARCIRVVQIAE